jgi:hypothetical protein
MKATGKLKKYQKTGSVHVSEIAFSDSRVMDVMKQEVRIVLNLGKLRPGVYFLIIDALDKNANEKDVVSRIIEL